jgi:hypothetical protein
MTLLQIVKQNKHRLAYETEQQQPSAAVDKDSKPPPAPASAATTQNQQDEVSIPVAEKSSEDAALGKKGYRLLELIGLGSYGKVRLAEYHRFKGGPTEVLACKIVNKNECPKEFVRKFFPRELDIIVTMDHPNIIRIHSILLREPKIYIFMQHAAHGDMLEYIMKVGALPEGQAQVWFKQLVGGLVYCHDHNVAHRQRYLIENRKTESLVRFTTPDHLLLDSAPNLGPLISRWEINKFENC